MSILAARVLPVALLVFHISFSQNTGLAQEQRSDELTSLLGKIRQSIELEEHPQMRCFQLQDLAELQSRAGLSGAASQTFESYKASLQDCSIDRSGRYPLGIQIGLLSRMGLAAHEAGDHDSSLSFLNKAVALANLGGQSTSRKASLAEVSDRAREFESLLKLALQIGEDSVAAKILKGADATLTLMDADETDKLSVRIGIMLSQAVAQLDMGQKNRARETTQALMAKFHEYLRASPCQDPRLAEIQARFGEVKDAMEWLNRCFSQRDEYLKKDSAQAARYRFYKARDLLSVGVALGIAGRLSNSDRLIGEAVALARSTPYDDEFYYWRRLVNKAIEVGRIDIVEEAVVSGYRDNPSENYHDIFRFLLNENRKDLIDALNDSDEARAILIQAYVERGDYPEAVRIGRALQSEEPHWGKTIRNLARAEAKVNGAEAAIIWAGRWKMPSSRFESLLGIADGLILRRQAKAEN